MKTRIIREGKGTGTTADVRVRNHWGHSGETKAAVCRNDRADAGSGDG